MAPNEVKAAHAHGNIKEKGSWNGFLEALSFFNSSWSGNPAAWTVLIHFHGAGSVIGLVPHHDPHPGSEPAASDESGNLPQTVHHDIRSDRFKELQADL